MPETLPVATAGLFTRDASHAPVPLTGVSIRADLSGFCARVAVSQRYVNIESTPIEAVYVFPLDEGAAVCGFEAIVDGTLVVGEVQEREKAFETYDEAIAQGHGAFLLDEHRPDVFQASIGNLPPGKEVLVRITYVTELGVDGTRARFTIPTTVSPRYAPAEDRTGVGQPDAQALNPPVDWRVPYGLDLSVAVRMPGRITTLESPSHPVSVSLDESGATVALAQANAALDRDFVLSIDAEGLDKPQAWTERDDKGNEAVAVALIPGFPETSSPAEIVFLVDRSGSMGGTSIEEVRNALQLCLRSMITGCRFNIIGFGSTYEALFPKSRAYDDASLEAASEHVRGMEADLGGTEILPALTFALEQRRESSLPRHIVVLTDGEVTNTDAVMALASKHAADTRVFTFGIGRGASHHLVRGLARAGRGAAEFIYPGERIEKKVVGQFAKLLSPALADVRLDWIGGEVTQAPAAVSPVFAGSRMLLYGFVKGERPPRAIRLSATSPSGPVRFDVPIDWSRIATGSTVTTLAARARIRELEEGAEWLTARGSRQKEKKENAVKREIIELSIRYGLVSRETSFVAVERRETPVTGEMQLRKVPIALTSGWGGLEEAPVMSMMPALRSIAARPMVLGEVYDWGAAEQELRAPSASARELPSEQYLPRRAEEERDLERRRRQQRAIRRPDELDLLVSLQAADGSWELSEKLASILGRTLSELERALSGAGGDPTLARRAWATALALAWLEKRADAWRDEWSPLANKGRRWIDDAAATAPGGWTWIDRAREFLVAV